MIEAIDLKKLCDFNICTQTGLREVVLYKESGKDFYVKIQDAYYPIVYRLTDFETLTLSTIDGNEKKFKVYVDDIPVVLSFLRGRK